MPSQRKVENIEQQPNVMLVVRGAYNLLSQGFVLVKHRDLCLVLLNNSRVYSSCSVVGDNTVMYSGDWGSNLTLGS